MMIALSNVMLYVAFAAVTALVLLYGLLQPWWRSWFGISMILTLTSLWQIMFRALVTLWLGEDYPRHEWVLLVGRMQIAAGATIAVVGLGRELVRSWRVARGPETATWSPREHFGDSSPVEESVEP